MYLVYLSIHLSVYLHYLTVYLLVCPSRYLSHFCTPSQSRACLWCPWVHIVRQRQYVIFLYSQQRWNWITFLVRRGGSLPQKSFTKKHAVAVLISLETITVAQHRKRWGLVHGCSLPSEPFPHSLHFILTWSLTKQAANYKGVIYVISGWFNVTDWHVSPTEAHQHNNITICFGCCSQPWSPQWFLSNI